MVSLEPALNRVSEQFKHFPAPARRTPHLAAIMLPQNVHEETGALVPLHIYHISWQFCFAVRCVLTSGRFRNKSGANYDPSTNTCNKYRRTKTDEKTSIACCPSLQEPLETKTCSPSACGSTGSTTSVLIGFGRVIQPTTREDTRHQSVSRSLDSVGHTWMNIVRATGRLRMHR